MALIVLLFATHRKYLLDVCASHIRLAAVLTSSSFGPVNQYHENSQYYSAIKPEPNPDIDNNLPHVTIQLPVYKESLELTM